tara:strand:+ start:803 stop:985 length:183 start_codon:yes stop_codon:yes gene_type:complete
MPTFYILKTNRRKMWTSLRYIGKAVASSRKQAVEEVDKRGKGRYYALSLADLTSKQVVKD